MQSFVNISKTASIGSRSWPSTNYTVFFVTVSDFSFAMHPSTQHLTVDMGLGKTLQSICILASKHHERRIKFKEAKSPDAVHLPSLIICPPTLTGHWYYEILKYVENLKPILYTGNSRERTRLLSKLGQHDVVITSYEVVRNDIGSLERMKWLYCILDEGHVIKNSKTKLTKAVKAIQAQHRLILSGTPIQNNVLELWSLFDFLMPGFLGTETSFSERFSKPILSNKDGKSKNAEAGTSFARWLRCVL